MYCDIIYDYILKENKMIKVLMSPSSAGKDYIQSLMIKDYRFNPIISTTSRPMRQGEVEGR